MITCPHCKTENPANAKFCLECGISLLAERPPQPHVQNDDGAIAQGDHNQVVGANGILVNGNIGGDLVTGTKINQQAGDHAIQVGQAETVNIHTAPDPRQIAAEEQAKARRTYLVKLRHYCQVLPLAALGGEEGAEDELSLDNVYIDLNTGIYILRKDLEAIRQGKKVNLTSATLGKESPEMLRREDEKKDVVPLPVLDAVLCTPRAVLLGDPGAGKSTFARKLLGMQAAVQIGECPAMVGIPGDLLPVMIILRELTPALSEPKLDTLPADQQKRSLLQMVFNHLTTELTRIHAAEFLPGLRSALENGQVLLVLDGLDEVPQALRQRVRQVVSSLLGEYHLQRLIITCRIRSYTNETAFANLQTFTLRGFDEEQIKNFVTGWYNAQEQSGHVRPADKPERIRDLSQAATSHHLREIASNPMMLTSMALIHQKEIGLPRERVRLYKLVVDVLIRRWQKYKLGESNMAPSAALVEFLKDENRLLATLERLAYEAHQSGKGKKEAADLPRKDALILLEAKEYLGSVGLAEEFLDYVDQRAGLLKGNGGELEKPTSYSFPHRTFQEYLAGCYLVRDRSAARQIHARAAEGDAWSLATQLGAEELVYNRRGAHVMLDIAYQLCPIHQPQNEQAQREALWSANMACLVELDEIEKDTESPSGGQTYLDHARQALVHTLGGVLPAIERADAGRALAKLGDPRPEVMTCEQMAFCHIPAGEFLFGDEKKKKVRLDEFWIGKYLVTNAQFAQFVAAKGYGNPAYWQEARQEKYWTRDGFQGRFDDAPLLAPLYIGEPYTLPNHPVVGVSWYEALAFTRWLTDQVSAFGKSWRVNDRETVFRENLKSGCWCVSLPGEEQWEKAARGTDGREYPWVGDFDADKANTGATGIGRTSVVGCFMGGQSVYGLLDSSGNVWQWTMSQMDTLRVLRGGSFRYAAKFACCTCRNGHDPDIRLNDTGFRVVVLPCR
jgi:formylglycine-generating enzyme required for sulfatase activity